MSYGTFYSRYGVILVEGVPDGIPFVDFHVCREEIQFCPIAANDEDRTKP